MRILAVLLALVLFTPAANAAPGDVKLVCPITPNPSQGQTVTCTYEVESPTTTTAVPSSTTTTVPTTTTTVPVTTPPTTTTTSSPQPPTDPSIGSAEWKATTGTNSENRTTVNGSVTTVADGQTIVDKTITGDLVVQHANVTVINARILGVVRGSNLRGLKMSHVDIGKASCPAASNGGTRLINGGNYTLENSRLHHNGADLVNLMAGNITIRSSLLDRTCYYSGDHLDAIQMYAPGDVVNLLVEKSMLDSRSVNGELGNGAVFIADNPGAASKFTFKNNLFAGGNYTTAFYDRGTFDVQDNKYVAGSFRYGPCTSNLPITFANNKLDTGQSVTC